MDRLAIDAHTVKMCQGTFQFQSKRCFAIKPAKMATFQPNLPARLKTLAHLGWSSNRRPHSHASQATIMASLASFMGSLARNESKQVESENKSFQ